MRSNRKFVVIALALGLCGSLFGQQQKAKKTVTNADLEKFRQSRTRAEADYRENYKQLGLISPEELEKLNQEDAKSREEFARKAREKQQQDQDYWQSRARGLRSEIANVDAQIRYLRTQIIHNSGSGSNVYLAPTAVYPIVNFPYGRYPQRQVIRPNMSAVNTQTPNVQAAINAAAAMPNPFANTPLNQSGIKVVIGQQNQGYGYRRPHRGGYYYPVVPYVQGNGYNAQNELTSNLRYYEQVRAGLIAQWNLLVEGAHRAGVKID